MKEKQKAQKIRLLYSLRDFQLALSSAVFLAECDSDSKYNVVELRRFRCFETTMIISYGRPFSQSRGGVPPLSFKLIGIKPNCEQGKLHKRLILLRNKVVAHSDTDMMRMVVKPFVKNFDESTSINYFLTKYDEGLEFLDQHLDTVVNWLHVVIERITERLFNEVQDDPESFQLRQDYLESSNW